MASATLETFGEEWFNHPEWWFSADNHIDARLSSIFESLIEDSVDRVNLFAVVVFDQLPRHYYRHQNANHIIDYFLEKALCMVDEMIRNDSHRTLSDIQLCFLLLPYRHSMNPSLINDALAIVWDRCPTRENSTLRRFLAATYQRIPHDAFASHYIYKSQALCSSYHWDSVFFSDVLDVINRPRTMSSKTLETHPCERAIHTIDTKQPYILSLSGGVDSMVCAYILKKHGIAFEAVYINYNNKEESHRETLFLEHWCNHMNIPLYVRTISEINRPACMNVELRDCYEAYTKNARYASYAYASPDVNVNVILGHNQDDCFENLLTNIAHNDKYENLRGMTVVSQQNEMTFYRPLLNLPKDDIYDYASQCAIPYLRDSTPKWSQRGIIRDVVRPTLVNWNAGCVKSLFSLADFVQDAHRALMDHVEQVYNSMQKEIGDKIVVYHFETKNLSTSPFFWKYLCARVAPFPSNKSIASFIEVLRQRMQRNVRATQQYCIHKTLTLFINSDRLPTRIEFHVTLSD